MKRALVVVTDSEQSRSMVRDAGVTASGYEASVVLYSEATRDDIDDATVVSGAGSDEIPPAINASVVESVRRFLDGVAEDELADLPVEYETVCSLVPSANHAESILQAAADYGCDHIFVTGKKRSPTGKAIFGDSIQTLLLNFDGRLTVELE